MRVQIPETVNRNCYVFQMGYTYPLLIWDRFNMYKAEKMLLQNFGEPAKEDHFSFPNRVRLYCRDQESDILNRRWYVGQRRWKRAKNPTYDFWMVFKSQKDRTLALMLLE